MILLDTNVLSEFMLDSPRAAVTNWLDQQPRQSIWTTSVTVMELRFGLFNMSPGKRQSAFVSALSRLLEEKIESRVAPFDLAAAYHAAELMALRRRAGRPGEMRDTMIAGIAIATRATLATRNTSHFSDLSISVVNPWSG